MKDCVKYSSLRRFGCQKTEIQSDYSESDGDGSCAVCGKEICCDSMYYDTYYQPLCLDCLKELHKL